MNNTKSLKHKIAKRLVKSVFRLNNVLKTNDLAGRGLTLMTVRDCVIYFRTVNG
jgi:hypothetical protein